MKAGQGRLFGQLCLEAGEGGREVGLISEVSVQSIILVFVSLGIDGQCSIHTIYTQKSGNRAEMGRGKEGL